jgi:fructose-bisphosphate aldolase, class I
MEQLSRGIKMVGTFDQQLEKIRTKDGFIAALDQSGGSTPKALKLYGINESAWSNDEEMYTVVHQMRTRIMTSPSFTGERILGAILFENTMDREVDGQPTADYLWKVKNIVPFLKVDKGLAPEDNGAQIMKPMPELDPLLKRAKNKNVFGTKMRSVIKQPKEGGINTVVAQQFEFAKRIIGAGLVPIIEPEVDINCPEKAKCEAFLKSSLMEHLNTLSASDKVMLKLTLPEETNLYLDCARHANVLKVVALSGGYPREEANRRLGQQKSMVASFSRALTEGLSAEQSDDAFHKMLDSSIESIFQSSCKG